jgi:hypothetical protein
MKLSGPVQLCTSNFGAGVSDQPASIVQPQNGLVLQTLSTPYRDVTYLFGTLRTRAKNLRSLICIFGVGIKYWGLNVWVPEGMFWNLAFLHRMDHTSKIFLCYAPL